MKKGALSIREIQSVSLEILKKVADICDEHNIRYILTYGTLLGAIRHKGFIPWDDDVDIMMPRPDYDRFCTLFESNKKNKNLHLFNQEKCATYPYGITRICDMEYKIHTENERDCDMGVFVDIYPLDGIGSSYEQGLKLMEESHLVCDKILLLTRKKIYCPHQPNIKKQLEYIYKKAKYSIRGKDYYFRLLDNITSRYSLEQSKYVGCAAWTFDPDKEIYRKSIVENRIKIPFEKYCFYVPKEYDEVLKVTYGDYMQLPPEDQRVYHHGYIAYKR